MLTDTTIKRLEDAGFKRWTKGNYDRLYISAKDLGLECSYYNTGNIKWAELNGEHVSNRQAGKMKCAKTYINVKTGRLYGDYAELKDLAAEIYEKVKGEEVA